MIRRKVVIGIVLCILCTLSFGAWLFYTLFQPVLTPVPDRQSHIQITIHFGEVPKVYEVIDPEERALLLRIFSQSYWAAPDSPSCPFGDVKISFIHQGRSIDFFPATDTCSLVRYGGGADLGNKIFGITIEDTHGLTRVWRMAMKKRE